jgi:hypothetical protein
MMMTEQLEADLIEAFSLRASAIPADISARVSEVDYHPRTRRLSPRLTVGALAGAAVTTGTVLSVAVLGGASPAFAGWTPSPTAALVGQTTTADASCQAQLASAPALPGSSDASGWTAVATDVRGPFTLVAYEDGAADASCLTGPSLTTVSTRTSVGGQMSASGSASALGGPVRTSVTVGGNGSDGIEQVSIDPLNSASQGPYTVVEGEIAADVTGVTLVRSDGQDIQASIGDGLFLAWWPGTASATTAEITTSGGVTSDPLSTPAPPPAGGTGTCGSSSSAGSATSRCAGS